MSVLKAFQNNRTLLFFWIIAILSVGARAYINFSQELLIGNGGYYPLQVRTLLEKGQLAFSDMPFLFYLDAGIVKLMSFLGVPPSDQLILIVVKCVDSISIPLLLIPLYHIFKLTKNKQFSYHSTIVIVYSVLSFYTLNLTSTSQKNALGITFLFFSIFLGIKYVLSKGFKKYLFLSLLFLILTGLTHFGTFAFTIIIGALFILFRFKRKALIPLCILLISGPALVYIFDQVRFERLISVWKELFISAPKPPQLLLLITSGAMAFFAIRGYKKFKNQFNSSERTIILTLISVLIVIPLPIINPQFTHRLTTFLFIPQVLLILFFSPLMSNRIKKTFSALLGLVSIASVLFVLFFKHDISLSKEALKDLDQLNLSISDPNNTVIISRHNLEFWVAWTLHVDVSQESKFDSILINDYQYVYILNQTSGLTKREGPPSNHDGPNHFNEPHVPRGSTILDSTEYFKLYQYNKDSPINK